MGWTLADIRTGFRSAVGKASTSQLSNTAIDTEINNYYQLILPQEIVPPELNDWYEFTTTADDWDYDIPSTVIAVRPPCFVEDYMIHFHMAESYFYSSHPPFDNYEVGIPFVFPMVFGIPEDQTGEPYDVLLQDRTLYFGPIPDDEYDVKIRCYNKPTALSGDTDTPLNEKWGPLILYGAAIDYLNRTGRKDEADELGSIYRKHKGSIDTLILQQIPTGSRIRPRF